MNIKSFDDLDITDPIMFGLVFSNKHIAKPFIEHLLDIKIDHLETPVPEAVLSYDAEHKGVRYDVFARETDEKGETIRSLIWKCRWSIPRNSRSVPGTTRVWAMAFPFRRADFIQILRISTSLFCAPRTSLGADSLFTISKTGLERTQTSLWETEPSKIFIYLVVP